MKEYIDRNKVLSLISRYSYTASEPPIYDEDEIKLKLLHRIYNEIELIPIDNVGEIIRCKNCKHRNPFGRKCLRDNLWHFNDDYCSYGEKRDR